MPGCHPNSPPEAAFRGRSRRKG
ncbi:hypothetical protein A2U01_0107373, partial [Trifolium medium]|nr:hypothetical protein [Trifolium medium]